MSEGLGNKDSFVDVLTTEYRRLNIMRQNFPKLPMNLYEVVRQLNAVESALELYNESPIHG